MFDTYVTIVGTVITTPEWRRTTTNQTLVANFKVASHSRKFDRDSGRWVDGDSLRVRVNCWRRLAEGVSSSVMVGDPVLVTGRMYTRDWLAEDGQRRVSYELEAVAVGHDLARGRGTFARHRPTTATSAVEDAESDGRVAGASTEAVPGQPRAGGAEGRSWGVAGVRTGADDPVEAEEYADDGDFDPVEFDAGRPDVEVPVIDAASILREAGLAHDAGPGFAAPFAAAQAEPGDEPSSDEPSSDEQGGSSDGAETAEPSVAGAGRGGRRGRSRTAVPV